MLPKGTLLYAMYASVGAVSQLLIDATVNQAIMGIAVDERVALPSFVFFALESQRQDVVATANSSTQANLNAQKVRNISIPHPDIETQHAIVRYLDHAEMRIARAIQAKSEIVRLLQEARAAIISEAVLGVGMEQAEPETYGSLSEVRVLEWLGSVPSSWKRSSIAGCFYENREMNSSLREGTVLSLSFGRVIVKPAERLHGLVPSSVAGYQIVNPGYIVIRPTDLQNDKTSLRVGLVANRGIITSAYMALIPRSGIDPDFASLLLSTYDFSKIFYGYGSGLRQNLSFSDIKHIPVMVPALQVQREIVENVAKRTSHIERAHRSALTEIDLLHEFRTRLIADVVTGKKDVRAEAASLPDVDPLELARVLSGASVIEEDVEEEVGANGD